MKLFIAGWAFVAFSTAAAAGGDPYPLSDADQKLIRSIVMNVLIDPMSAQFGGIKASVYINKVVVCGLVNSKNQMGGYTGMSPFMMHARIGRADFSLIEIAATNRDRETLMSLCMARGASFTQADFAITWTASQP